MEELQEDVKLVPPSNPILKEEMPKFEWINAPVNPVELYNLLGKKLIEYKGLGLSANQLGLPYRAFVIRSDPIKGFFNPRIVDASDEVIELEEGCLTYPGLIAKVKRPRIIRIRYAEPPGNFVTETYQDMTARIIQHEVDHLNGITIGNRISRLALEMAIKKASKKGYHYKIGDFL